VRLPAGYKYGRIESDTFEGEFVAKSGRMVIHHDIGGAAGAWAQKLNAEFFEERVVEGARVWVAQRARGGEGKAETLVAATFPDNGCANFFVVAKGAGYRGVVEGVAGSFRPKNTARDLTGRCEQRGN
jgi:predicted mannosyl-3-phosphoglycerate phosphatase (HAD superfamily)